MITGHLCIKDIKINNNCYQSIMTLKDYPRLLCRYCYPFMMDWEKIEDCKIIRQYIENAKNKSDKEIEIKIAGMI